MYLYAEVPSGIVTDQSLIEAYLTYGKETKPSCAIQEDDVNKDTTKSGLHYQLQYSTSVDDMW